VYPEDDVTGAIVCDSLSAAPFFRKKNDGHKKSPKLTLNDEPKTHCGARKREQEMHLTSYYNVALKISPERTARPSTASNSKTSFPS
jgi:hypothetical protein